MSNSIVDFRVARVEGYYALGLYRRGEKEPFEYKVYDNLKILVLDLKTTFQMLESIELELDTEIIDLLNLKR